MRHINTTDGFVVRRRPMGGPNSSRPTIGDTQQGVPDRFMDVDKPKNEKNLPLVTRRESVGMDANAMANPTEATGSLEGVNLQLDNEKSLNKNQQPDKKLGKDKPKKKWPVKRIVKWSAIVLSVAILSFGGYFVYKLFATGGQIFKGNIVNAVFAPAKRLQADANGRSSVLLFGTSEDDPDHAGADLTDSMMIVSVNQDTKDAFLISVPRDLYVDYGRACPAGYQGKLNALYSCIKGASGEEAGQDALRKKVGEIFGLDVQYAAHVNYAALRDAVDAVGGITVTIQSSDTRGILDRNFDWDCPKGLYTCYNVKYPNGPATLNGKQALYLARARGANGDTYGLPQANFDREKYQREILVALKDKAVSAGTLSNPIVVNNLLDTLGKNVRTNFSAEEIKTLVDLAQKVNSNNILTLQLNDPNGELVTTGNIGGQSIVKPSKGLYDYSDIQKAVKAYATGDRASLEKAVVDVLNASGTPGLATTKATDLQSQNITTGVVANAPSSLNTAPIQVFDMTGGNKKPATRAKLAKLLGTTVQDAPKGGITGVSTSADFVIIIGTQPQQ